MSNTADRVRAVDRIDTSPHFREADAVRLNRMFQGSDTTEMLEVLLRNAGRVCGRALLLEQVWDFNFDPGSNLVDVYVRRLREKIDAGRETRLLHTVRGSGYVLKEDKP